MGVLFLSILCHVNFLFLPKSIFYNISVKARYIQQLLVVLKLWWTILWVYKFYSIFVSSIYIWTTKCIFISNRKYSSYIYIIAWVFCMFSMVEVMPFLILNVLTLLLKVFELKTQRQKLLVCISHIDIFLSLLYMIYS